jgi:hypothetical protein
MLHKRELPDIISITDASMIRQFIDSGKVWRLDEFLEQYCADSHLLTDFPEDMKQKQIREYGGRYAFVNTIFRSGYAYMEHLAIDNVQVRALMASGRVFCYMGNISNTSINASDYITTGPLIADNGNRPLSGLHDKRHKSPSPKLRIGRRRFLL